MNYSRAWVLTGDKRKNKPGFKVSHILVYLYFSRVFSFSENCLTRAQIYRARSPYFHTRQKISRNGEAKVLTIYVLVGFQGWWGKETNLPNRMERFSRKRWDHSGVGRGMTDKCGPLSFGWWRVLARGLTFGYETMQIALALEAGLEEGLWKWNERFSLAPIGPRGLPSHWGDVKFSLGSWFLAVVYHECRLQEYFHFLATYSGRRLGD